jgi:peroxiredoxin
MESEPKSLLGLACAMQIVRYAPDGPEVEESADVIAREHAGNKDLAYLCERLREKSTRSGPMLLRAIVAANTNADVLAQASYSLATSLKRQVAKADPGPPSDNAAQEAEKMYELVISKFAETKMDGGTLGERADSDLFELRFLRPGKVAREITGRDADGETFSLKDYGGKVVLLVFSSRNCAPCVAMYPQFKEMLGRWQSQGFEVLGVMDDAKLRDLKRSIDEGKITWRCWWDGFKGPISQMWNVHSWPTLYLIDRKGVIRHRDLKGKALEEAVGKLLAEQ